MILPNIILGGTDFAMSFSRLDVWEMLKTTVLKPIYSD